MQLLLHVRRKTFQATPVRHHEVLTPLLPFDFRIRDVMEDRLGVTDHVAESRLSDQVLDETWRAHAHGRWRRLARGRRQRRSDDARDQEDADLVRHAPDSNADPPTGTQHASHLPQRAEWL